MSYFSDHKCETGVLRFLMSKKDDKNRTAPFVPSLCYSRREIIRCIVSADQILYSLCLEYACHMSATAENIWLKLYSVITVFIMFLPPVAKLVGLFMF